MKSACRNRAYWDDPENRKKHAETLRKVHAKRAPEKEAERVRKIREGNKRTKALHPENVVASFKGKHHSAKTKEQIRRKAIENRAAMTPEEIQQNHQKAVENLHKTIPDMSAFKAQQIVDGKVRFNTGRFYSEKNGEELFYRSSYELAAFHILEQMSVVKGYSTECEIIPYEFEDAIRRYVPDLKVEYLDGSVDIIEVKADWAIDLPVNQAKFDAARKYCSDHDFGFVVWTEVNQPKLAGL